MPDQSVPSTDYGQTHFRFIAKLMLLVINLDQITRRKLVLSKLMYHRAIEFSNKKYSKIDGIMALLVLDLTVETTLKIAITSLEHTPLHNFPALVKQVQSSLSAENIKIPPTSHIEWVHTLRNNAQHQAAEPSKSDLDECRIYVRDFLKDFVTIMYGIDFEKISLAMLIRHPRIKQHLVDAETYFENGDYEKAVECANVGFKTALDLAGRGYVGYPLDFTLQKIKIKEDFDSTEYANDTARAEKTISDTFKLIQDTVRDLALDLKYVELWDFEGIAGSVHSNYDGSHPIHEMKKNIEKDEATFVLSFAIDKIIQFEERVKNLDAHAQAGPI